MAIYLAALAVVVAALLQASTPEIGPLAGVKPDLVLTLALTVGVRLGFRQGVLLSLLGGLVLDIFSGAPFGFGLLALLVVMPLVQLHNLDLIESNVLLSMLIVFLGTLAYYAILGLGTLAQGGELWWLSTATTLVLPAAAMNTLIAPFPYYLLGWLGRRKPLLREKWG